jgi:hypothetical protein
MPFAQFQAMTLSRADMHRFLAYLNSHLSPPIPDHAFDLLFEVMWPKFQSELAALPGAPASEIREDKPVRAHRPDRELLEELLALVRQMNARLPRES